MLCFWLLDEGGDRLPTHVVTVNHSGVSLGAVEAVARESVEGFFENYVHLKAGEVHSEAAMDAVAEREVLPRVTTHVELVGVVEH